MYRLRGLIMELSSHSAEFKRMCSGMKRFINSSNTYYTVSVSELQKQKRVINLSQNTSSSCTVVVCRTLMDY